MLGAVRGAAEESTFRRAFALVSPDVLDRVLGAWLWTRAVQAGGRLVIAIDGKTVRGAKGKGAKAPHLVAALAHGIGTVLGQVAVDEKSNEIPAVRDLLKAFASLASAVITIDAMHTQSDTAQVILGRGADYVITVEHGAHCSRDPVAELEQSALDVLVSPAVVVGGGRLDERGDLGAGRRAFRVVREVCFFLARRRCHRRRVPGGPAGVPAAVWAAAGSAWPAPHWSAQSSRGRGSLRRSMATSCRSTSSSARFDAGDWPGKTSKPQSRTKMR